MITNKIKYECQKRFKKKKLHCILMISRNIRVAYVKHTLFATTCV